MFQRSKDKEFIREKGFASNSAFPGGERAAVKTLLESI